MKKSLSLTIVMTDPDHKPVKEEKVILVETGAPWLTCERIIDAIYKIAEEQHCSVEVR